MRLVKPICLKCGRPAHGTMEILTAVATFEEDPTADGIVKYGGQTDIYWDDQKTVRAKSPGLGGLPRIRVECIDGHEWFTEVENWPE